MGLGEITAAGRTPEAPSPPRGACPPETSVMEAAALQGHPQGRLSSLLQARLLAATAHENAGVRWSATRGPYRVTRGPHFCPSKGRATVTTVLLRRAAEPRAMASVPAVPEFRDADQCRQHGLEIIRPKPRRLGDLNRPHDTRMPAEGASLRASHRDLVGGSAPSLNKLSVRDLWPSPSGRSSHEASPRPCLSASSPGPPGSNRATPVRETTPGLCGGGGGGGSRASPGSLALSAAATRVSPAHNKLSLPEAAMTREQDDQLLHDEGFSPDPNFSVYRDSASNTDCGSLSKSSSDGDPVVSRRKPLARLKSRRRNILSFPLNPEDPRLGMRRHDLYAGGSSSDENRSSGHASMSDGGQSSYASSTSPPTYLDFARGTPSATPLTKSLHNVPGHLKAVPEDDRVPTSSISASRLCRRSQPSSSSSSHGRRGYRSSSGGGYELHDASSANLDDIRLAVEQLAARTQQGSCSGGGGYSTSTYSSDAEPGGGTGVRRLMRHSSLETIATNITSAEEFVWVDNLQARLVEMQRAPWTNHDVLRVLQSGRLRDQRRKISMEVVPRLSFLLQRPLAVPSAGRVRQAAGERRPVRGAVAGAGRELRERVSTGPPPCTPRRRATSCGWARARARGLQLPVGRFQRWACDARLAPCVHEYGALYLTAAAENLLEELVLRCLEPGATLTAAALEAAIAGSGELWGLFQPFAHLNAGRTATGRQLMEAPGARLASCACPADLPREQSESRLEVPEAGPDEARNGVGLRWRRNWPFGLIRSAPRTSARDWGQEEAERRHHPAYSDATALLKRKR
ncbi:hypothetical protein HPB48_009520 [Haemaphysalis longicornis]|uniref:Uncharacterized protein n=1 Tax=Haemaphysalis longicornis TaxID=44386 RepID=A0A9J6GE82_HAELO|nr:hypothetical protein HPB48_009520 [Haemaphysalis longicornis]